MIMNPRRIDECIESFERMPIERAWLTGYSERELVDVVAQMLEATPEFTHYIWASDDLVVNEEALAAVLAALEDGHPVVTGYCNFDLTDDPRVGLSMSPLLTERPTLESYDFPTQQQIDEAPGDPVRTWFAGFVLTAMSREMWLRYPFQLGPAGAQTDYSLCWRLQQDDVPIVAPKAARVLHVKDVWGVYPDADPRKRLLIGEIPAEVRYEIASHA